MSRDFVGALLQLNAEKQVPREVLVRALEEGIETAYRRVAGEEDIHVRIDQETGRTRVFRARTVVDEVEDPLTQFTLEEARQHSPSASVGDLIEYEQLDGETYGRIGAQTAKQIILQRIREVERDQVFDQFADKEGELITGSVNRVEPRAIILDVGKNVEAILATTEQSQLEHYRIGQNVKAYVLEVRRATRGPQIYVSRTHKGFVRRLFELEVPEIHAGTVEVKAIAREAGSRSKVAVSSRQEGLDPVGATVGQRGARVQAVVAELGGEKIDVIPWSDDPALFVANALSPAQVLGVDINEEHRIATVTVPERMLSLAIGREGQNARLAAKLTGWRIDIRSDVSAAEAGQGGSQPSVGEAAESAVAEAPSADATAATAEAPATNESEPEAQPAAAEAAAKPARKRATKATKATAAEAEEPVADSTAAPATEAPAAKPATNESEPEAQPTAAEAAAKPARKRATKATKATAAEAEEPVADSTAAPATEAPAAKPARKRTTKAAADKTTEATPDGAASSSNGTAAETKPARASRSKVAAAKGESS